MKVGAALLLLLGAKESLASTTMTSSSLSSAIANPLALFTLSPMMTRPEPIPPRIHHTDTMSSAKAHSTTAASSQQPSQQSCLCAVNTSGAMPTSSALYPIHTYEIPYVMGAGAGASTTSYINATVYTDPNGLSFLLTTYSSGDAVYTSNLGIIVPGIMSTATTAPGQNATAQPSNATAPKSTSTSVVTATSVIITTKSTTKIVTLNGQHPTPAAVTVRQPYHRPTSPPSWYVTPVAEPEHRQGMNAFKPKPFAELRSLLWAAVRGQNVQARQEQLLEPDEVDYVEPASSQHDIEADSPEKREAKGGGGRGGGRGGGGGCIGCSSAGNRTSTPGLSSPLALFVAMLAMLTPLLGIGAAPVEAGHAGASPGAASDNMAVVARDVDLTAQINGTVQKWECDHGASFPHYDGCGNATPKIRRGPSALTIVLAVLACLVVLPMAAAAPVELNVDAEVHAVATTKANELGTSISTSISETALYFAAPTEYTPSQPGTAVLELRAEAVRADDSEPTCVHDGHAIYSNCCSDDGAPATLMRAFLLPSTLSSPVFWLSWAVTTFVMAYVCDETWIIDVDVKPAIGLVSGLIAGAVVQGVWGGR